ncbi:hypothetical protein BKA80DRAFT_273149 [Phyllosticta citrichinensis]
MDFLDQRARDSAAFCHRHARFGIAAAILPPPPLDPTPLPPMLQLDSWCSFILSITESLQSTTSQPRSHGSRRCGQASHMRGAFLQAEPGLSRPDPDTSGCFGSGPITWDRDQSPLYPPFIPRLHSPSQIRILRMIKIGTAHTMLAFRPAIAQPFIAAPADNLKLLESLATALHA